MISPHLKCCEGHTETLLKDSFKTKKKGGLFKAMQKQKIFLKGG